MMNLATLIKFSQKIKRDIVAVYRIARDTRTPIYLRGFALCVAAYALSPIDLIPDFIPVIGYIDDLLIVPLGLIIVIYLTPELVLKDARENATALTSQPKSYAAAVVVVLIWLFGLSAFVYWWLAK